MILYAQRRFANPHGGKAKLESVDPLGLLEEINPEKDTLKGKLAAIRLKWKIEFEKLGYYYTGWIYEQMARQERAGTGHRLSDKAFFLKLRLSDPVANLCAECLKPQPIRFYTEESTDNRKCYDCLGSDQQARVIAGDYKSKK